ncbi:MAG: flavoprotein [Gammaproteobacteria bacterium]|nr:flavoprotein [Gammaproteobacteria bacterium]MCB1922989.1 flavoprotein [Gammaproteobacteria bacterium]
MADGGRIAWAITGSGHYIKECLALAEQLSNVDLFLSAAGAEVLQAYGHPVKALKERFRIFRDTAASAPPVGLFYEGVYDLLVIAPATSNSVAKMVWGISDSLVTNVYAQAGKCRVPSIVFACDVAPELDTEAPSGMVKVYPRRIDLANTDRLREFEYTQVVASLDELDAALPARSPCRSSTSCS